MNKQLAKMMFLVFLTVIFSCSIGSAEVQACEHNLWGFDCDLSKDYCEKCEGFATLSYREKCKSCKGTGLVSCSCGGKKVTTKECGPCNGTGKQRNGYPCWVCRGKGYQEYANSCLVCGGTGKTRCRVSNCLNGYYTVKTETCVKCGYIPKCCEYSSSHRNVCPICSSGVYANFAYSTIVRSADQYRGTVGSVTGSVISVVREGETNVYRIVLSNKENDIPRFWNIVYHKNDAAPILLVGDNVTVFGEFIDVNNSLEPTILSVFSAFE